MLTKNKFHRISLVFSVVLVLALAISACSSQQPEQVVQGDAPARTEEVLPAAEQLPTEPPPEPVETEIQVELGQKMVTAEDLVKLKVGDIIQLNRFAGDELSIKIEGITKLKGLPGQYKGNKATQITTLLLDNDE